MLKESTGWLPRVLLALVFTYGGLEGAWQLLIGPPWIPPVTPAAGAFMGALVTFVPLWVLVKLVEGVGAIALWTSRYAPLGTLLVLPISVVICIFQFTINAEFGLPIGIAVFLVQSWALWHYRFRYMPFLAAPDADNRNAVSSVPNLA